MYDDFDYGYDEGSDIDNWEDEQVFQDGVLERMEDVDWWEDDEDRGDMEYDDDEGEWFDPYE